MKEKYNKEQCVYGPRSNMDCRICSRMCKERYEDFKKRNIKIEWV